MAILRTLVFLLWLQPLMADFHLEVKDASGAPMRASVLLEHLATGQLHRAQAGSDGQLTVSSLPLGRYRLQVSQTGFATYTSIIDIPARGMLTRIVRLAVGVSSYAVDVVGATPLAGIELIPDEIPSPVQASTHRDIEASGALDLPNFLNRRMRGVFINEMQGNPFQVDLNYRGYTVSPLLGTPQGISVYYDGVRLNQPFGDVVSWDLIPKIAISEVAIIPGSNPLFGLNTLGGAVSLRTKDGRIFPGTTLQFGGGRFSRKTVDIEHGGASRNGFNWYAASSLFFEEGWRESSPSNVRQFIGKLGWQRENATIGLSLSYANNSLIGNGLQEQRFLGRDYRSAYTKPDLTANRSPFLNLTGRRSLSPAVAFSGLVYFRYIRTRTLNGDINEESLDQSVYQPGAAERAALAAAGYTGFPTSGENASNTPFPFWRCLANVLLRDEPSEKCNGQLNRSGTHQRNYGIAAQLNWFSAWDGHRNQLTAGASYDGNRIGFSQSTELGYLNLDRSVTGVAAFGDGITGGSANGEPYDTRVELSSRVRSMSFFATDTLSAGSRLDLTISGRFNRTLIDNGDIIRPSAGTGSLSGRHVLQRFNPAAGMTFHAATFFNLYFNYSEGSRAPTAIELGCADPASPCKLPNALAGDPPLNQVLTRTFEAGVRSGGEPNFSWTAGYFRAENRHDLLFVASEQTGFGYFKNIKKTRRHGFEFDASARLGRVQVGVGYTLLDATFRSEETVNGASNSTNEKAEAGLYGLEGAIKIKSGDRIPLVPRSSFKIHSDVPLTRRLVLQVGVVGISQSYARGNENNRHVADGTYYLGPGYSPGYTVINAGARYQIHARGQLYVQLDNIFDRRYYSGAQLGPNGFTNEGAFVARPFAAQGNELAVQQSTFYAPGAPFGVWGGIRIRF